MVRAADCRGAEEEDAWGGGRRGGSPGGQLHLGQPGQLVHGAGCPGCTCCDLLTLFIGFIQGEEALRSLQSIESSQMDAPNIIPRGELDNRSR